MPGASGQYHEYTTSDARAGTPYTSPPLNDDFDAITTQRWSRTTRATTVEPTCSALYEQLEAVTRATTPAVAGFKDPQRRKRKTGHSDVGSRKQQDATVATHGRSLRRTLGKDRIKSGSANGQARIGPTARQDYEIVEYQVLEDGPERTVSISTWREQAIQDADSDDELSVYYVNAADCITADVPEVVVFPVRAGENSGSNNSGHRSKSGSGKRRGEETHSAEKLASSKGSSAKTNDSAGSSLNSSGPRSSTPRGSGTLVVQNVDGPADTFPFHATKSGSTISSIYPTPTLEHVLVSCEPSLVHISPVLQRVGIMRAEHLRAVGKLSEDTRNREVKEEVLKLGVTVVEWAILLDKLQSL